MAQPLQQAHPSTLINLPPPNSNPDTPSEIPGTPTSTATSLSAVSTTAIKDGHRGHAAHHHHHHHHGGPGNPRGHSHTLSANNAEAERADRIGRLAGLSSVSTLRAPLAAGAASHVGGDTQNQGNASAAEDLSLNSNGQTTPTSTPGLPNNAVSPVNPATAPGGYTPAYFDAAGQPVAATKMSSVGTASATDSVAGRTTATELGDGDLDMHSMDTDEDRNATGTEMDSASASGYMAGDAMDEDQDMLATRSNFGFEDRMSDDGNASLVGFGEGAGSTISGPIYQRRPVPWQIAAANQAQVPGPLERGLERSNSGFSDGVMFSGASTTSGGRRDTLRGAADREHMFSPAGQEPLGNQTTPYERRDVRMTDGATPDGIGTRVIPVGGTASSEDDVFTAATAQSSVPVLQPPTSAIRETQRPYSHQQTAQAHWQQHMDLGLGMNATITPASAARGRLVNGSGNLGDRTRGPQVGTFFLEPRK